jgi:CheY-specific phosphatase CheX
MTNEEVIDQVVTSSCTSLFVDYALALEQIDPKKLTGRMNMTFCGVIGFTGDQLRGTLVLATSDEALGRTLPSSGSSMREWIAELSNQLLGRIKNKLVAHNVMLHMSTPLVLRGELISPVSKTPLAPYTFACDAGAVCVWVDVEIVPGVDLTQVSDAPDMMSEGSGFLF